jgi:trehalose-6-phosphatase
VDGFNMERKQVNAILSDYDGTLYPTTAIRDDSSNSEGTIPQELEQILFRISKYIPVCIISSKDFAFLHRRARFANILSCVLGIETIIHSPHYTNNNEIDNFDYIRYQRLITSSHFLMDSSKLLHNIVEILQTHNYKGYNNRREVYL